MKKTILLVILFGAIFTQTNAQLFSSTKTNFDLSTATIVVDQNDFTLVKKAAELLQQDIAAVTGKRIPILHTANKSAKNNILIGSITNSSLIKTFISKNKVSVDAIKNKWEGYQLQVVDNNLVIVGSDRRGTAYGVFELTKQMGVSPWYWWADVPVKKQPALYINTKIILTDAPKVKYRGIFINDEAPALSGWTKEKFGGFNHLFYGKVFELMLRLKSNYIWPAMWGNAFYYDDSLNIKTADEYGIVIGTSHHEPLMRAHEEWKYFGKGQKWNYDSTETGLKEFWRGGMQRAWNEKIVSVGMRGDGDEPMSRETATALLERIVKDQRRIIAETTGKPAAETPQLWALYKEVQDYYDKGMRVPDDVTLLLCDDNWGNIRKLPKITDPPRKGGYGIYYHFDYVGGPRNYKWLNTNPIPRVWEQMHLAYEYNVKDIWIVNVGDIKPMEFPISFFLDYAWNPEKIGPDDLQKYTEQWSAAQFGMQHSKEIAGIISTYGKYNGRRKPELLDASTYSLLNYQEADIITRTYNDLCHQAEAISAALPAEYHDAFYQLVLHPVKACSNLQNLYYNVAWNNFYAVDNLAAANKYADLAKYYYEQDSSITAEYHHLNNGKWNHMMSQTHIGYTYWQQPPVNKMPKVKYFEDDRIMEIMTYQIIEDKSPKFNIPASAAKNSFYELDSCISIEANHFTSAFNSKNITWKILPDLGKTGSAITTFPVTAVEQSPGGNSPQLQYEIYTYSTGECKINAFFSPTLNFHNTPTGLQYAISIDDETPQIISINKDDNNTRVWEKWVADNIIIKTTTHKILTEGKHTVKYWMVNSGVVLQKIVVDFGGAKKSYLGPPETIDK